VYTFLGVIPWTYALTYMGVVVEDNWERVLGYFDVPTLIIGGILVAGAALWYVRRRRSRASAVSGEVDVESDLLQSEERRREKVVEGDPE
jgi:LPXTG-motif cell wall-anchored protein